MASGKGLLRGLSGGRPLLQKADGSSAVERHGPDAGVPTAGDLSDVGADSVSLKRVGHWGKTLIREERVSAKRRGGVAVAPNKGTRHARPAVAPDDQVATSAAVERRGAVPQGAGVT